MAPFPSHPDVSGLLCLSSKVTSKYPPLVNCNISSRRTFYYIQQGMNLFYILISNRNSIVVKIFYSILSAFGKQAKLYRVLDDPRIQHSNNQLSNIEVIAIILIYKTKKTSSSCILHLTISCSLRLSFVFFCFSMSIENNT